MSSKAMTRRVDYGGEKVGRPLGMVAWAGLAGTCIISIGATIASTVAIAGFQREAGQWVLYGTRRWDYYTLWGQDRPIEVVLVWTFLICLITLSAIMFRGDSFRRWWWIIGIHLCATFAAIYCIVEAARPLNP